MEFYKQYKDRSVFFFPTPPALSGMEDVLSKIAQFVLKLASSSSVGSPLEEGYIAHGIRVEEAVGKTGVERAIDMLLDKIAGRLFSTEIPIETLAKIAPLLF